MLNKIFSFDYVIEGPSEKEFTKIIEAFFSLSIVQLNDEDKNLYKTLAVLSVTGRQLDFLKAYFFFKTDSKSVLQEFFIRRKATENQEN